MIKQGMIYHQNVLLLFLDKLIEGPTFVKNFREPIGLQTLKVSSPSHFLRVT